MRLSRGTGTTKTGTTLAAVLALALAAAPAAAADPPDPPPTPPSVQAGLKATDGPSTPAASNGPLTPAASNGPSTPAASADPDAADGPSSSEPSGPATSSRATAKPSTPAATAEPSTPAPSAGPSTTAEPSPTASAGPTAEPSATGSPAPAKGTELHVVLMVPEPTVRPGEKVKATAHVYATGPAAEAGRLKVAADGGAGAAPSCELSAGGCDLGDVTAEGELVPIELSIPAKAKPGSLRVTTAVSASTAPAKTVVHVLSVAKKTAAAPGSPSASPKPSTSPTPSTAAAPPASTPAAPSTTSAPAATNPHSVLPSEVPQEALPGASEPENTDGGLPPIVADVPAAAPPLGVPQNVAAIRPDTPGPDTDTLARVQSVWLGLLLVLFVVFSVRLRHRPLRGAHRRTTRGRFAR